MRTKSIFLLLVLMVFTFQVGYSQTFEIRSVNKGSGIIGVEMRETSGSGVPSTSDFILDIVFGLRWDTAYDVTLNNSVSSNYNIARQGSISTSGAYDYQAYAANNTPFNFPSNWSQNTWVEIASITNLQDGSGTGTFEICPSSFNGTTDPNININASDFTPTPNGSASSVSLGSSIVWIGTTADWSTSSNWTGGNIPTDHQGASIPASPTGGNFPSLSTTTHIKELEIASGARVDLNGQTFTIRGDISGTGVVRGSSASNLTFEGSNATSLSMDQTTTGTTNVLQNLTVNRSGGLTLSNALRVTGILTPTAGTITTGGNLTLAASGATTYSQIDGGGTGSFSGNIVMEKYLTNTNTAWRQFSLPLVGDLTGFANIDLLYSSHGTANQRNVFYWDATDAGSGVAGGWISSASSGDQTRGYSIYSNNSAGGLHDISQTITYTGTYDKSDRSYAIKATQDPASAGGTATGWNFIGNPYPSNYDLTTLFTNWPGSVTYKAIHAWDAPSGQYIAILGSGASIVNYNTSGGSGSSTVLAPMQGFWIKANSDVTFTIPNAYRTTSATGLGTFLKKDYDLARLDVYDMDSAWDQTVVYFTEEATSGFENNYDGYKLLSINTEVPSLYSVNPDGILSISALNSDASMHTVPLGFRSKKHGKMSFSLNKTELDEKWYVYIEDKELGVFYNIKEKDYTFNHTQNSDSRFVLHFQTYALSNGKLIDNVESMTISGDGNEVYAFVPSYFRTQNYRMTVYDFSGKLVYESNNLELNTGMNSLHIPLNQSAYYIVKIQAAEGLSTGKVFLR